MSDESPQRAVVPRKRALRIKHKDHIGCGLQKWDQITRMFEDGHPLRTCLVRYGALRREYMRTTEASPERLERYQKAEQLMAGHLIDKALDYTEAVASDAAGASAYARTALAVAAKLHPSKWADKPAAGVGVTLVVNTNLGELIESVPDLDGSLAIAGPVKTVPATRGRRAPKGT